MKDFRETASALRQLVEDDPDILGRDVIEHAVQLLYDAAWGRDSAITLLADYRSTDNLADAANYLQESFEITDEEIDETLAAREEGDDD